MGIGEVAGGHIEMGGKGPARAAARSIPPEQRSSDRRMTLREQPHSRKERFEAVLNSKAVK